MTEIRFYHLQHQSQERVLPILLSKALERGHRIILKFADEQSVLHYNEFLWTYAPESFLPHGCKKDGCAAAQPIWLTAEDENPNKADVLILTQGVESEMQGQFSLCCEMLNGQSEEAVRAARSRWKAYKEKGFDVTYWQQDDRGVWEKKA